MSKFEKLVEDYYENYYEKVHAIQWKTGLLSFHKKIERPYDTKAFSARILEVGSGEGQHLNLVRQKYDCYIATDIREIRNQTFCLIGAGVLPDSPGLYKAKGDATALSYPDSSFDRVIAGCLLLHLNDPLSAISEWLRLLNTGGHIDALIPNDQNLLVRVYSVFWSRRKAKKLGCRDFDLVKLIEHVTYYQRVTKLIDASFDSATIKYDHFPPLFGLFSTFRAYSILRMVKN